jgi:hypothetical protein
MSEIVNLRLHRKRKRRAEKNEAASANRLAHGRSKTEAMTQKGLRALEDKRLEMHRRMPEEERDG